MKGVSLDLGVGRSLMTGPWLPLWHRESYPFVSHLDFDVYPGFQRGKKKSVIFPWHYSTLQWRSADSRPSIRPPGCDWICVLGMGVRVQEARCHDGWGSIGTLVDLDSQSTYMSPSKWLALGTWMVFPVQLEWLPFFWGLKEPMQ